MGNAVCCCSHSLLGFSVRSLVLCVLSNTAIISLAKRESCLLYFSCVLNVMSLLSSLTLPRGAMGWSVECDCAFPGHTHLLFDTDQAQQNDRPDLDPNSLTL